METHNLIQPSDPKQLNSLTPQQLISEIREIAEQYQREVPGGRRHWPESIRCRILALSRLGMEQQSVEITITERTYKKLIHSQAKYKLKDEYNKTDKDVIITAPGPVKLKPGCQYSVDFALSVVSDKYEFHLPLERQRRKMESGGLNIDAKTLFDLTRTVARHCDEAVIPKIRRDIQSDFCALHLDESPWPINGSKVSARPTT